MARSELIRPLSELLRVHAERRGDKLAYADEHREVGYAELERRTARLAGHLAGLGVPRGARVVILLGNRVENVESYLTAIRAAAVGVPVNPRSSDAELAHILRDSGATVVITDLAHWSQVRTALAGRDEVVVLLVGTSEVPAGPGPAPRLYEELATTDAPEPPRDDLGLDDVAWMLYTSGTTGLPKGVLSTQRSCLWSVSACYVPLLGLSQDDHVLWPLPLFHSFAHVVCVHGVIATGASVRIVDGLAPDDVVSLLREDRYTFLVGVPTLYHHLIRVARTDGLDAYSLRVCVVTGAVTTAALGNAFEDTFGVRLVDSYGSTETCGAITMSRPSGAQVPGSCGQPVPGLKVRLVDQRTGEDVEVGAEGEVWVRGPNVMLGYHNQPEATATALDGGWYRTGDLARRDELGYLTITGRIKELIVRGGENIHPAEVEAVVRAVDGVADVAVAGKPHEVLGEVPVAFVVPDEPGVVDTAAIFAACREHLSYYKVPDEIHEIGEVPRTASGKVTRRRLLDAETRLCATRETTLESLFRLDWTPVSAVPFVPPEAGAWAVLGDGDLGLTAAGVPVAVHLDLDSLAATARTPEVVLFPAHAGEHGRVRDLVERWQADGRFPGARLVLVTRQAVATAADDVPEPTTAPF
ncbi:class I adenylate-forming enzyme family protein [Amycolatopsis albispora]|uniref:Uncharacterized protein n=1 Tax=Amycolatopsis albispora TaxID=1804986 RepID=A0A344L337_9PSEU|nr:class I adenylate-forming enzyme family protein [Amycolatopsis albispora]AXB42461.1 hypothetical protein A4R43_07905 [Amycolatopsis albispora]